MKKTIAIDAMGGDYGASVTVPAGLRLLDQNPDVHLIFVGLEDILRAKLMRRAKHLRSRWTIHHAPEVVDMDESPSQALRGKKESSMRLAINLVKSGDADACVSAGNTGALMATARFVLKTLPGVDRPAIIASMPTHNYGQVHLLDLGANVDVKPEQLFQFAVMGSTLVHSVHHIERPTVGLLNVGEEAIKGNDVVKETATLLEGHPDLNYIGYIEGNQIFSGNVDVVVCDGFVGNILLKTTEGLVKLIKSFAKEATQARWWSRLAALPALPVFRDLIKKIDPDQYNGATLLGLDGIVVKSHGSASVSAFTSALHEALQEIEHNVPDQIRSGVNQILQGSDIE